MHNPEIGVVFSFEKKKHDQEVMLNTVDEFLQRQFFSCIDRTAKGLVT